MQQATMICQEEMRTINLDSKSDGFFPKCWVVLWIYKELLVLVLWKFQLQRIVNSSFSKKIQNPTTTSSSYFRSLTRTRSFHERIESSLADYLTFYIFWKAQLYTKVSSLHSFKHQQVNVFIPRLITTGYLSLILRTGQQEVLTSNPLMYLNPYMYFLAQRWWQIVQPLLAALNTFLGTFFYAA
jgi:hypothetical protein